MTDERQLSASGRPFAAALFDMDGTLVDSSAVVEAIWAEFAAEFDVDLAMLMQISHGRRTEDTVREVLPAHHDRDHDAIIAAIVAKETSRTEGIVEVPGAAALLHSLGEGQRAVVTSANRTLAEGRLASAGVPVPAVVIGAEDVAHGKPSPEGYRAAAERLGVAIEDCVVFEDAEAGIRAGLDSGAAVVVVGAYESDTTRGLDRVPNLLGVRSSVLRGMAPLPNG